MIFIVINRLKIIKYKDEITLLLPFKFITFDFINSEKSLLSKNYFQK